MYLINLNTFQFPDQFEELIESIVQEESDKIENRMIQNDQIT